MWESHFNSKLDCLGARAHTDKKTWKESPWIVIFHFMTTDSRAVTEIFFVFLRETSFVKDTEKHGGTAGSLTALGSRVQSWVLVTAECMVMFRFPISSDVWKNMPVASIPGAFFPRSQCSRDRLWILCIYRLQNAYCSAFSSAGRLRTIFNGEDNWCSVWDLG